MVFEKLVLMYMKKVTFLINAEVSLLLVEEKNIEIISHNFRRLIAVHF